MFYVDFHTHYNTPIVEEERFDGRGFLPLPKVSCYSPRSCTRTIKRGNDTSSTSMYIHHAASQARVFQALIQGCFSSISRLGRLSGAESRQDWINPTTWFVFKGSIEAGAANVARTGHVSTSDHNYTRHFFSPSTPAEENKQRRHPQRAVDETAVRLEGASRTP